MKIAVLFRGTSSQGSLTPRGTAPPLENFRGNSYCGCECNVAARVRKPYIE